MELNIEALSLKDEQKSQRIGYPKTTATAIRIRYITAFFTFISISSILVIDPSPGKPEEDKRESDYDDKKDP